MNKFCNEILNVDLLKLADIKVDFRNDDTHELKGLYVVDERRLKDLDKDSLFKLHKDGYLQHLYMIGASMGNVNKLISLKNNR